MYRRLQQLTLSIERFTELTGRAVAWLTLAMVLAICAVVIMRYFLERGSIALQESITYLHALVFMLGAAYTLKQGGHVRVDIFYQRFTPRQQAIVDILGGLLFLLPLCLFILFSCWDYVASSWAIREASSERQGLAFVYLLKSLLLLLPITLLLQGLADIINNLLFVLGVSSEKTASSEKTDKERD